MRTANGDGGLEAHDLSQHFGPAHHRQRPRPCRHQFGIILLDRRRHHDHLGLAQIIAALANFHGDPHVAQALHIGVGGHVRALHHITLVVQDLGDTAHADAANADEMNRPDIAGHLHGVGLPWIWVFLPASVSAISASRSTALGLPRAAAALAARLSWSGSLNSS